MYMPSTDVIVKSIIRPWFSLGLLAGLALFFDRFLIPFIPKFELSIKLYSLYNFSSIYAYKYNTTSIGTT